MSNFFTPLQHLFARFDICHYPALVIRIGGLEVVSTFSRNPYEQLMLVLAGMALVFIAGCIFIKFEIGSPNPTNPNSNSNSNSKAPRLDLYFCLYTFVTGVFAAIRAILDTGQILLIAAAAHNMFEGLIVTSLVFGNSESTFFKISAARLRKFIVIFFVGWFIMLACLSLHYAAILEQQFGVMFDYAMMLTFFLLWRRADADWLPCWQWGLLGCISHLGQIYTLLLGVFIKFSPTGEIINEMVLALTAVITYFSFYKFLIAFYEQLSKPNKKDRKYSFVPLAEQLKEKKGVAIVSVILVLVLGFATVAGVSFLPFCQDDGVSYTTSDTLLGYTEVNLRSPEQSTAFVQQVLPLMKAVQRNPDNILYNIFLDEPRTKVLFIEEWKDRAALLRHMSSDVVKKYFRSEYTQGMMQNYSLSGPWHRVESASREGLALHFSFNFLLNSSVPEVWKVISNWKDVSWVKGATLIPPTADQPKNTRKLQFGESLQVTQILLESDSNLHRLRFQVIYTPQLLLQSAEFKVLLKVAGANTFVEWLVEGKAPKGSNCTLIREEFEKQVLSSNVKFLQELF